MEKHAAPIRAQIQSANPTASSVEVEKMVQDQLVTESAANPEIDFIRDLQQQYNKDVRARPFAEGDSTRQALSRGVATRDLNNEFAYRITEKLKGGTLPELKIEEVKDMRALIEGRLNENIVDPATGAVSTVAIRPTTDHVNGIINAVKSLNSSPTDRAKLKEDSRKEIEAILSDPRFGGIRLEE